MTLQEKAREWAEKNWSDPSDKGAINILERAYLAGAAGAMEWVPVSERLPTIEDCEHTFDEVLTIQLGREKPTLMKYWEIRHCPFTSHWVRLFAYPSKEEKISVKTLPPHPEKESV